MIKPQPVSAPSNRRPINLSDVAGAIGAKVHGLRRHAGWTRSRLAKAAKVSERYLTQLEKGDANVSIGVLERIASALGSDIGTLILTATGYQDGNAASAPVARLLMSLTHREQEAALEALKRHVAQNRQRLKGIALVGLRGAGKSTLGRALADAVGLPFVSVTMLIEELGGMRTGELFSLGGTEAYRALETEAIDRVIARHGMCVAETAGGIVENIAAYDALLGSFRSVWLRATPQEHMARVLNQGDERPLKGHARAIEHICGLLAARSPRYALADYQLDTTGRDPSDCLAELARLTRPLLNAAATTA